MTHTCVMNLQQRLQNKLDWLKSTKGIKTADAKLTAEELENIVRLLEAKNFIEETHSNMWSEK